MKRIKLLSLFMAVIVILFGSGCLTGDPSEKELEEYKQRVPYQKPLADKYQPELPGYELEFRKTNYEIDPKEDGYTFGAQIYTFFITIEGQEYEVFFDVKNQYGITTFQIFELETRTILKECSIKTESVYGSDFFYEFEDLAYQDGEFFAITRASYEDHRAYYNVINSRPIAFYKVDFELEKVYYLGYAKGWYEVVIDNIYTPIASRGNDYRVVKK